MIRVLHVIGAMDRAGAETMIMNLYRAIDRDSIQFDFLVHEDRECDYDEEIQELGGRIWRAPRFNGANYFAYRKRVRQIIDEHPEDEIVHGHIGSCAPIYLSEARKLGRVAVAHSHAQHYPLSPMELVFRALTFPTRFTADEFLACSWQAGSDRFGGAVVDGDHFHVLSNGIPLDRYANSPENHLRAKKALGLEDSFVVGHVGRFVSVKNHEFLIDAFEQVTLARPDSKLLLIGQGELQDEICQKASRSGLGDKVIFYGSTDDVPAVLKAMDVFVLPSLSEGLSMASIEAQAAGIPVVLSDGVPEATAIAPTAQRLSLELGPERWASEILSIRDFEPRWAESLSDVRKAGFDINDSARWLSAFYEKSVLRVRA